MSRIEITTLNAALIDLDGPVEDSYLYAVDVVLSFGEAEVARWSVTPPHFRYDDDRRRFLEEFIADKLRPLFEEKAA